MEVYAESLATKGHKQLDHSSAGLDLVILELLQRATVDSGQVKHIQDKMESPEQWVIAYQHNVGNFDKVDGYNHYSMVAHYLQRIVAQVLDMIAGIAVVEF